jgi:hypothetical protein
VLAVAGLVLALASGLMDRRTARRTATALVPASGD